MGLNIATQTAPGRPETRMHSDAMVQTATLGCRRNGISAAGPLSRRGRRARPSRAGLFQHESGLTGDMAHFFKDNDRQTAGGKPVRT